MTRIPSCTGTPISEQAIEDSRRYPFLSLHGIEGACSAPGVKIVIPARVKGKFSIRTVPNMEPYHLSQLVKSHLEKTFASLKTKNTLNVEELHAGNGGLRRLITVIPGQLPRRLRGCLMSNLIDEGGREYSCYFDISGLSWEECSFVAYGKGCLYLVEQTNG